MQWHDNYVSYSMVIIIILHLLSYSLARGSNFIWILRSPRPKNIFHLAKLELTVYKKKKSLNLLI